jgi:hypothetical protein
MAAWIELHAPAVAISISTIALLISAFSLWLTWRRDRKAEEATHPLVELHIAPHPIEPSIHAMTIAITNRMDHHIYVQNISIHRPKAAAFVAHHEERDSHEPPTIFREKRGRSSGRVCLSAKEQWGQVRYLDIGSSGGVVRLMLKIEFDFIELSKQSKTVWIGRTINSSRS